MSVVKIDWNPDSAGYRGFGRTVFVGFTLIGLFLWWVRGSATHLPWFVGIPLAIWALAWISPPLSRPFYLLWMGVAWVMGTIISTVLLAVIYWLMFGFVGLSFRLLRRDRLRLSPPGGDGSTWVSHPGVPPRTRYERQF